MNRIFQKLPDRYSEIRIEDEAILMDAASGEFYSLSGTARSIWDAIDGVRSEEALAAHLSEEFGAERAEIAGDLAALLEDLEKTGFVAA